MISNTIVYLIGPPGVGKMTIGTVVADALQARLIHNHLWLNPIFTLVDQDGVTPLPSEVWSLTDAVRRNVFKAARELTPASWNLVFTHAAVGQNDRDTGISSEIVQVASHRRARLLVVQLVCSPDELARRVSYPERRSMMKESDVEAAKRNAVLPSFTPAYPWVCKLDVTSLTPSEAAREIIRLLDA